MDVTDLIFTSGMVCYTFIVSGIQCLFWYASEGHYIEKHYEYMHIPEKFKSNDECF